MGAILDAGSIPATSTILQDVVMIKKFAIFNVAFSLGMLFGTVISSVTIFYAFPNVIKNEEIVHLTRELMQCQVKTPNEPEEQK